MKYDEHEYIMMLTPHDPFQDPRVKWVAELCAEYAPVEIFGTVYVDDKPNIEEYTDKIIIKRKLVIPTLATKVVTGIINPTRTLHKIFKKEALNSAEDLSGKLTIIEKFIVGIERFFERTIADTIKFMLAVNLLSKTLYDEATINKVPPKLIICHDLYALPAAIRLKKLYDCKLIYDSHEYFLDSILSQPMGLRSYIRYIEGRLLKKVDTVITVNPQLADLLSNEYKIPVPISVPNAVPYEEYSPQMKPENTPIQFLLQGQVTPHRGIGELLDLWSHINDKRVTLIIRAPQNDYLLQLQTRYQELIKAGYLIFADAVNEDQLVDFAHEADIGIIPYIGPNPNHVYASPNKLSQYMQAGLAILYCQDMLFVGDKVRQYECGFSYDPNHIMEFKQLVQNVIDSPEALFDMKQNAVKAAKDDFNWEKQSEGYSDAIERYI